MLFEKDSYLSNVSTLDENLSIERLVSLHDSGEIF